MDKNGVSKSNIHAFFEELLNYGSPWINHVEEFLSIHHRKLEYMIFGTGSYSTIFILKYQYQKQIQSMKQNYNSNSSSSIIKDELGIWERTEVEGNIMN